MTIGHWITFEMNELLDLNYYNILVRHQPGSSGDQQYQRAAGNDENMGIAPATMLADLRPIGG